MALLESVLVPLGTKMPNFFDPANFEKSGPDDILNGDENRQIKALRDYLINLTPDTHPKIPAATPKPVVTAPPTSESQTQPAAVAPADSSK